MGYYFWQEGSVACTKEAIRAGGEDLSWLTMAIVGKWLLL